jgi:diguanylate cyclase (GGDEF)-like protein
MDKRAVVLLVDDIASNIQTLAHLLKDEYDLKVATSGSRALELATQQPLPDLILLDIEMPDMSGYEVLRQLKVRSDTAAIPIIFVSVKDMVEDEEYGLSLGAVDYIIKPIRPSIAKARVKTQIMLKQQHDLLLAMATRDQLTGLSNRHFMSDALKRKVSHAKRHDEALCIIMADIDHFKKINDTYGHLVGDEVLRAVAKVLQESAREEDIAARFGGEEFVLVLDNCKAADAALKAEKLRAQIEALHPEGISVTSSFGVAAFDEKVKNYEELLNRADSALYQAKDEGRNRVVISKENTENEQ